MIISVLAKPSELTSFLSLFPPLATTTIVAFLGYVLVWHILGIPAARALRLERVPLSFAIAIFSGNMFALTRLFEFNLNPTGLFRYSIILFSSVLVGVGSYHLVATILRSNSRTNRLTVASLLFPVATTVLLIFLWVEMYPVGVFMSSATVLLAIVAVASVSSMYAILFKMGKVMLARMILFAVTIVLCVSPVATLILQDTSVDPSPAPARTHNIKHVILIVIDTLRRDALSCYDSTTQPTPHIDGLADGAVVFTDAISSGPWTLPGMASILSGLSPSVHLTNRTESALPDSVRTLTEYMRDAGYHTAAIGTNIVLSPKRNFSQGFCEYDWYPRPADDGSFGKKVLRATFPDSYRMDVSTPEITDLAVKWLEVNRNSDFFLWVHYYDPHHPYSPPYDYLPDQSPPKSMGMVFKSRKRVQDGTLTLSVEERDWVRDLYLGEVRFVDANVGRLFDTLKRLEMYDESLIILTSDHGEEFWEHDRFEHGHTLYDELLSVPLIVKLPRSKPSKHIDTIVPTQGITPTVLALCGIDFDPTRFEVGSLSPLWGPNPDLYEPHPVFGSGVLYYEDREAVYFDDLKFIRSLVTGREALYDRRNDPHERLSTVRDHPKVVFHAGELLREHGELAADMRKFYGITKIEFRPDQETLRRLKSLGYM